MSDVDRWINLEGPEPPVIRKILDAVRDVPELTPEEDAALTRSIYRAIEARRRRDRLVLGAVVCGALALAAGVVVVARALLERHVDVEVADLPSVAADASAPSSSVPVAPRGPVTPGRREPRKAPPDR